MAFVYPATMLIKYSKVLNLEKRFILSYIKNNGINDRYIKFFKLKLDSLLLYHKKENWRVCIESLNYDIRNRILFALTELCLIKGDVSDLQLQALKRIFLYFGECSSNVSTFIKSIKSGERQVSIREHISVPAKNIIDNLQTRGKQELQERIISQNDQHSKTAISNTVIQQISSNNDYDACSYTLQYNDLGYGIRFFSPSLSFDYILPYEYGDISDIYEDDTAVFAAVDSFEKAITLRIPENSEAKAMFCLDLEKLTQLERETKESQRILAEVFGTENDDIVEKIISSNNPTIELLKILLEKECWTRVEVEQLCQSRGVMLGATLEQINDYAYGKIDDAVIEDDGDEIYVTTEYKDKLL